MAASAAVRLLSVLGAVLSSCAVHAKKANFYDLSVFDIDGRPLSFSGLTGRVSLVVNVASYCGLTKRNYEELVQLQAKYGREGFTVLAFPCNQFNKQEPESNSRIKLFASHNYSANFPILAKTIVNPPWCGSPSDPSGAPSNLGLGACSADSAACCAPNDSVYRTLREALPGEIEWNFAKFLISKEGVPLKRFSPQTPPLDLIPDIEEALKKEFVYTA